MATCIPHTSHTASIRYLVAAAPNGAIMFTSDVFEDSISDREIMIKSNRKAMNRNWSNQKANPALKTKAGNK